VTAAQAHHSSRVVIADCGGGVVVFGPVHTERGLRDLRRRLEAAGWSIHRDARLASVAQFKDNPAAWRAASRGGAR
jgi:hypothetical protein